MPLKYEVFPFTIHLETVIDGETYAMKYGGDSDLLEANMHAMKQGYFKLLRDMGKFHDSTRLTTPEEGTGVKCP